MRKIINRLSYAQVFGVAPCLFGPTGDDAEPLHPIAPRSRMTLVAKVDRTRRQSGIGFIVLPRLCPSTALPRAKAAVHDAP